MKKILLFPFRFVKNIINKIINYIYNKIEKICYYVLKNTRGYFIIDLREKKNYDPYVKYIQPELNDILDDLVSDNSYLYEFFTLPVKEDDIIIFPAALNHEIAPQGPTKEPRITISSNIRIE